MAWQQQVAEIVADKRSGASAITAAMGQALLALASESTFSTTAELIAEMNHAAPQIFRAQTGMASLFWLYNRVLFAVSAETNPTDATTALRSTVETFIAEQERLRNEAAR